MTDLNKFFAELKKLAKEGRERITVTMYDNNGKVWNVMEFIPNGEILKSGEISKTTKNRFAAPLLAAYTSKYEIK